MPQSIQELFLQLQESFEGFGSHFKTVKTTVQDESAALADRLERIEQKLDEILVELRRTDR